MTEFRFFSYTDYTIATNRSQNFVNLPIAPYQAVATTQKPLSDYPSTELDIPYTVFEILVAIVSIIGNVLVIIVFQRERKLRRRTNYYIVSLAMADFLVGSLGIPFAILASLGLPRNLDACLFTVSVLVVLCTISIFCLLAVSVDRYWAILYPMAYSRNVRTRTAIVIISMCWVAGGIVGFLPLFGWHATVGPEQECLFVQVMSYDYLVFLYFATIITPALLMLGFYTHIYRVIIKQVRQIVTMNPASELSRRSSTAPMQVTTPGRPGHTGTMLRVLGAARKRDVKATQNLSIIVLFFMICWIPLYTINCIKAFCPDCFVPPQLTLFCIILSHLNSAVNPVLYAYHLKDFRSALKNLLLKMMGVDVDQHAEAIHRFSMASQHRLQSMDANMRTTQPRVYVGEYSPIWLRQQQEALKNSQLLPKCGVVQPCFNNINHTVAAVASVTTEMEREMWNIVEASSGAEVGEVSYEFPSAKRDSDRESNLSIPAPTPQAAVQATAQRRCDSAFSYDNHNYSISADDDSEADLANNEDEVEFEDVFVPPNSQNHGIDPVELRRSLVHVMREKLRSDDTDYRPQQANQLQECPADFEPTRAKPRPCSTQISPTNGSLAAQLRAKLLTGNSNSAHCLPAESSGAVYVIESETNPLSPGHKPKYRKSTAHTRNSLKKSHSCTCSSDPNVPDHGHAGEMANNNNLGDRHETFLGPLKSVGSFMQHSNFFHLFQPHEKSTTSNVKSTSSTPSMAMPASGSQLVVDETASASAPSSPSLVAAVGES